MRNMEKLGIFFSALLISITLFFVIQTGSSNSQNISPMPDNHTYPTPTIVPKTITQTTITYTSQASYVISQSDIDEILTNSEWEGLKISDYKYINGTTYDLRIKNGNFSNLLIYSDGRAGCLEEGIIYFNKTHIQKYYTQNYCHTYLIHTRDDVRLTWVSKDSFTLHFKEIWYSISIIYNRKISRHNLMT